MRAFTSDWSVRSSKNFNFTTSPAPSNICVLANMVYIRSESGRDITIRRSNRRSGPAPFILSQISKPSPRRPALDLPITEPDMLDDRRGNQVALAVGQRAQLLHYLEAERKATPRHSSSATVGSQSATHHYRT